jgi:hypothetical protein
LSPDAAKALEVATAYERARASNEHLDEAWFLLSPWTRRTIGSSTTFFDAEHRRNAVAASAGSIGAPTRDETELNARTLGSRYADLSANADLGRAFVVPITPINGDPVVRVVVAPLRGGENWRVWLAVEPGMFGALAYPEGCASYGMSRRRCDVLVTVVRSALAIDPATVIATWLMPDEGCGEEPPDSDKLVLCTRTQGYGGGVRFDMADGTSKRQNVFCGVGGGPACAGDNPKVQAAEPMNGYWDVPCGSEPGPNGNCATPIPPPDDPDHLGVPLRIATQDIPVGAVGHHELELGRATLVNGYLAAASFEIDQVMDTFLLDGYVRLEVRPTIAGRPPFENGYVHGLWPGGEPVRVFLTWDVLQADPGSLLHVRNVVVR